jgi:hypothetical protein
MVTIKTGYSQTTQNLTIVFIRHGEKPKVGDNLTCQGINRSLQLPAVIKAKFGIPDYVLVPGLGLGEATKHSRMFQTVIPLAAKYNIILNTSHAEKDSIAIAADLKSKKGTVLVVWEHKAIAPIIRSLGVSMNLKWPDDDYDSIWIVTFTNGEAVFTKDTEGLKPSTDCAY